DKEILYSRAIKAGKRIYYLDVKKNLKEDLFLAITESKKVQNKENSQLTFEKHKIFLYKEDFDKFMTGMADVIEYIKKCNGQKPVEEIISSEEELQEIKIDIDF
ncbi:MAG: PUR family DNA/RNA-binding protein, partial [Tannerellaceae bacterium]|nr:PUR family DNA/RNA-binding protein [Tannerellaceae bacterium]